MKREYNKVMKKSVLFYWLGLVLMLLPTALSAQEEKGDSIHQYDLSECDWVDFCDNPKYAIVVKDGKKGVYDLILQKNITPIEYREIDYMRQEISEEDSLVSSWFFAKKGIMKGILCVFEHDNSTMGIWMEDPDEVCSLEECTTIDKKMTKKATKLLRAFLKKQQMENVQLVVLDARTGLLKTWIRLDGDMQKDEAGKLLMHSCSASLALPFRDGKPLKTYDLNATSPIMMAVGYNCLANNGVLIMPTLKADSVIIEEGALDDATIEKLWGTLGVERIARPQLAWLEKDVEWVGYAATEEIFEEKDYDHTSVIGKQIQFAGFFPKANPLYTICVVGDKLSPYASPALFQYVVNPLVEWMMKRK